jgi:hypothetical protein
MQDNKFLRPGHLRRTEAKRSSRKSMRERDSNYTHNSYEEKGYPNRHEFILDYRVITKGFAGYSNDFFAEQNKVIK